MYPAVANKAKNRVRNEATKVSLFKLGRFPSPANRRDSDMFIQKTE